MKKYFLYPFAAVLIFVVSMAIFVLAGIRVPALSEVPPHEANVTTVPEPPVVTTPQQINRSKESYKIYSAILAHKWNRGNIVIRDTTNRGVFQSDDWLERNLGNSSPDAVADFKTANEKDIHLENHFDYDGKLALVGQEEFKLTIGGGDGWDKFKSHHPGATGIVTFSAVGFDRTGTHALVNVSYVCPGLCGSGSLYILDKRNREWAVSQVIGILMA